MPFVEAKGIVGLVFVPDEVKNKKYNCDDCFSCQFCSDARCATCLSEKARKKDIYNEIYAIHSLIKDKIIERLSQFKKIWLDKDGLTLFEELVFCLLTPQSKAKMANRVVENLKSKNLLFSDDWFLISNEASLVRFKNNKAKYIIEARKKIGDSNIENLLKFIDENDILKSRERLVANIKGFGYKEASHFLRNIGLGETIAILDRHILKNLKKYSVINEIPKSLDKKRYLEIEELLMKFSDDLKIPAVELDFVFWYSEAKEVFK